MIFTFFCNFSFGMFLIPLFLVFSCNNPNSDLEKSLKTEILAIHDEAMPKMDDLYRLRKEMKSTMIKVDSNENPDRFKELLQAGVLLHKTDSFMMSWMRNYKTDLKELNQEERINYLKSELVSVKRMRDQVFSNLQLAEELILKKE